jgi:acyl-CoA thioesterase I
MHISNFPKFRCMLAIAYSLLQMPVFAAPRTIIVFGDSITEGNALPKEERSQAWMNQVEIQSKGKLVMINEGKGGRPTAAVADFGAMLKRQPRADVLVIALGTNDSRDISDQCVPKAIKNLESMVSKARGSYGENLAILLVAPPNIRKDALGPTRPIANQREARLQELGSAYATLAENLKCDFVSLYGVVPESTLARDGVHPSGPGNQPIAEAILAKLLSIQTKK